MNRKSTQKTFTTLKKNRLFENNSLLFSLFISHFLLFHIKKSVAETVTDFFLFNKLYSLPLFVLDDSFILPSLAGTGSALAFNVLLPLAVLPVS